VLLRGPNEGRVEKGGQLFRAVIFLVIRLWNRVESQCEETEKNLSMESFNIPDSEYFLSSYHKETLTASGSSLDPRWINVIRPLSVAACSRWFS
jgi:hypothetical protein